MQLRRLRINGYRGIEELVWCPSPGVNCLIGPGDVGKSTVLDAIATVLSAAPGRVASEHDYFAGEVSRGFSIEVLLGNLDDELLSAWPVAPLWTWFANEKRVQADPDPDGEAVLCVRAKGTEDLEIEHVIVDPSEGESSLSPSRRQRFGLSMMGSAATAYRELRMSRGSLLSRNVDAEQLRSLVTEAVQATRDNFTPSDEVMSRLRALSEELETIAPGAGTLNLALLSPRGQSLLGMVGLFAKRGTASVPLANAGLGTQQLTLFMLARLLIEGSPLFIIDEIESGLEPFRQRDLIARIRATIGRNGQAFLTTHSPAVIGELQTEELHRLTRREDAAASVVVVSRGLEQVRLEDPEALLCRLPVMVEGGTEQGLLEALLEGRAADELRTTLGALGIRLVDGGGQPRVFKVTDALRSVGQTFAAFLDSEEAHRGKREELRSCDQVAYGTYTNARCFEDALSKQLPLPELDRLIAIPDREGHERTESRYQQLNEYAGAQSRKTLVQLAAGLGEERCRELFRDVANKREWFKGRAEGLVVGTFLREHHANLPITCDVSKFWTEALSLIADQMPSKRQTDDESST